MSVDGHPAALAMSFWHNIADSDIERKMVENGCFPWDLSVYNGETPTRNEIQCGNVEDTFIDDILPGLNIFDIYRYCYFDSEEDRTETVKLGNKVTTYKAGFTAQEYAPWFFSNPKLQDKSVSTCVSGKHLSYFLNRIDV